MRLHLLLMLFNWSQSVTDHVLIMLLSLRRQEGNQQQVRNKGSWSSCKESAGFAVNVWVVFSKCLNVIQCISPSINHPLKITCMSSLLESKAFSGTCGRHTFLNFRSHVWVTCSQGRRRGGWALTWGCASAGNISIFWQMPQSDRRRCCCCCCCC